MDEIRDNIQAEAKDAWFKADCVGTLAMGTGTGKSKVAIDIVSQLVKAHEENTLGVVPYKVMLVTPTIILHDHNWRLEFLKFNALAIYEKLERVCYVSLPKYNPDDYDLIIFDEYHHISEKGFEEFSSKIQPNKTKILGLTATPPKRGDRKSRFEEVCPVIYSYSIAEAAGTIVNDFHITVIKVPLDKVIKNVKGGSKAKPFYTTEQGTYDYYTKLVDQAKFNNDKDGLMWQSLARKRVLDTLPSRVAYAKKIIEAELEGFKSIIFAPSITQAEQVCVNTFHSKVDDQGIQAFIAGTIDRISAVNKADEGLTLGKVEKALIMKLNSTDKTMVQRIGRVCRNSMDKISEVYVLVYENTVEDGYLREALSSIDAGKVAYKTIDNYIRTN